MHSSSLSVPDKWLWFCLTAAERTLIAGMTPVKSSWMRGVRLKTTWQRCLLAERTNVYVDGSLMRLNVQDPGSFFDFLASGLFSLLYQGEKVKISRSLEGKQAIRQCHFFPLTGLLTLGFSVQLWLSLFLWHVTSTEPRLEYVIWHEIKGDTPEETVQQKVTCAKVEHNHTPWGNTKLQKHRQWFPNI